MKLCLIRASFALVALVAASGCASRAVPPPAVGTTTVTSATQESQLPAASWDGDESPAPAAAPKQAEPAPAPLPADLPNER